MKRQMRDDDLEQEMTLGFGARLREARERRGMKQDELAAESGFSVRMVGRYERGDNLPDLVRLARLARALGVTIDYLVLGSSAAGVRDARLLCRLMKVDALRPHRVEEALCLLDALLASAFRPAVPARRPEALR